MACKICGYKGELRFGVCWYCAEAESIIADGTDMNDNGVGDRPAQTALEKVRLLLNHSWRHYGLGTNGKLLLEANDLLRSAFAIALRDGKDTNWEAFRSQVNKALIAQHESGLTSRALDGGDSAPSQALSTPEVGSIGEADSTPPAAQ